MRFFLILFIFLNTYAYSDRELVLKLDHNESNTINVEEFIKIHHKSNQPNRIIFEFYDSNDGFALKVGSGDLEARRKEIYNKTYPNGDFYYLIGDLSDSWTKSDYAKFYSVAKWLSQRGFRTIINVSAYEPDLQEAISNENTTAIIWNSHGSKSGTIFDTTKVAIDEKVFTNLITPNLKYVLFANCFGLASARKYGLNKMEGVRAQGWEGTVTSNDLFKYIFSTDFDESLSKAIGKDITKKSSQKIEI